MGRRASPEEMQKLEAVIKSAIGFNAVPRRQRDRGKHSRSKRKISRNRKNCSPTLNARNCSVAHQVGDSRDEFGLFFFVVVRPFMRWITDSFQDTVEDMLPKTIEELEELQSVDNSSAWNERGVAGS